MQKKPNYILLSSLFLLLTSLSIMIWLDPVTKYFKNSKSERKILSSLYFHYPDIHEYGFQVIKFKIHDKVMVDIYKIFPDNRFELLNQLDTKTKFDGYFLLGSNATNLALVDIDEDAIQDIIVPGFDKNLVAYLNVIRYEPTTKNFSILNEIVDLTPTK